MNKALKYLVYVESPLQLVTALSFVGLEYTRLEVWYRDNGIENQNRQFEQILALRLKQSTNIIVKRIVLSKTKSISRNMKYLFFSLFFCFKSMFTKNIVVGDIRTLLYALLEQFVLLTNSNIYVVDDGMYLYPYLEQNTRYFRNTVFVTNLPIHNIGNFTSIPIPASKLKLAPHSNPERLVFIGSKLVEFGLCRHDDFFDTLEKIYTQLNSHGNEFIYVAHREEHQDNLYLLEKKGFKVERLYLPLELYEEMNGHMGSIYISFYSSALYNLASNSVKGDGREFISILPQKEFWLKNNKNIESVYKLFNDIEQIQVREI